MTVRVLIIDDQPSFRRAARNVVELTQGFEVAGEEPDDQTQWGANVALQPT